MNYHRPRDPAALASDWDGVSGPGPEKQPAEDRKGSKAAPAAAFGPGLKAVKCRSIGACPSAALRIFKKQFVEINIRDLSKFESGSLVDKGVLIQEGLVRGRNDGIVLLGKGDISIPLTIKVNRISKGARGKIEGAGGTVEVI